MSTLTELAILKKPTIIIPIPDSHQVENAIEFGRNNAAVVLDQTKLNKSKLVSTVKSLLSDKPQLENLSRNIGKILPENAAQKMIDIIFGK
jgi:UDP-N-acetylglucosamine:LPS N-acetylglucosamine transferase